jgi:hypothetical protein
MDPGSSSGRVMAGLSLHVVEVARADGVELGDVLAAHQVSLEDLRASDAFVPIETHEALWAEGARRTGRADFGLHAASRFPPGLTGAVEYLLRNCATVEDAALTWVRLASVVSNRIEGALVEGGASMRLEWRLDRPLGLGVAHWSEFAQARTLQLMRDALGEPTLAPLEVWVRHEPLGAPEAAARWFGAPLRYGRPCAALVWDRALLARPLQWVDGDARAALEAAWRASARGSRPTTTPRRWVLGSAPPSPGPCSRPGTTCASNPSPTRWRSGRGRSRRGWRARAWRSAPSSTR